MFTAVFIVPEYEPPPPPPVAVVLPKTELPPEFPLTPAR
jgi:hypothetical protein